MVDRRKQRVPRTATDSKSKKSNPIERASGSAAKQDLVSNLGPGQRSRLDRKALAEPPRVGSGAGNIAGQELPTAEILLVDCGSDAGVHSVIALLDGLRVAAVSSVSELQQHLLLGMKTEGPCAVLCTTCSRDDESRGLVDKSLRSVGSKPFLVIDECFDDDYGHLLLERGALDYLDGRNLSSEKLSRRIEWAILRNWHRVPTLSPLRDHAADGDQSDLRRTYERLPPRQREVLDLLLGRQTAKQIARRLGINVKSVHGQLAKLRIKFGADSSQDLIIVVLRALYQE